MKKQVTVSNKKFEIRKLEKYLSEVVKHLKEIIICHSNYKIESCSNNYDSTRNNGYFEVLYSFLEGNNEYELHISMKRTKRKRSKK